MNPQTLGLLDSLHGSPRRLSGAHEASFTIDGVEILVTYNEVGSYMAATETDPAEPPYKTLVSVVVGSQEVWGASAEAWDDRFQLMAMVEEQRL